MFFAGFDLRLQDMSKSVRVSLVKTRTNTWNESGLVVCTECGGASEERTLLRGFNHNTGTN